MIKHIFFDLDHTLWDFERNSEECLKIIHEIHLKEIISLDDFINTFRIENKLLWRQLEFNQISHDELRKARFQNTLKALNHQCSETESLAMNTKFMEHLPFQKHLLEGCIEILEYLKPKYKLHIISNGYLDIQTQKMTQSNILHYFDAIITSDIAKTRKPDPEIFEFSLKHTGATRENSIYIGDDEIADKVGALNAKMPFIYYNIKADDNSDTEINHLLYLKNIL